MVGDGIGFLCSPLQPPQPKPIWAFDSSAESLPKLPKVVVTSVLADVGAQKPEETFEVEPVPLFHENSCLRTFESSMDTIDTVSRHSFDSWTVPKMSDPEPPSNRVLHEAHRQEIDSFMQGVERNPTSLKKLIQKSRGDLTEGSKNWFDSLGGGSSCDGRMRFMTSMSFLKGSWTW